MTVGIIGGSGWIGSSLGRALIETGQCAAEDIVILNRAGRPGPFFGHAVGWATSAADLVARSSIIVISVRPQDWAALQLDAKGKAVISVMAGVPLRALPPRCIRALPNAAAELRQSYTPWFAGPDTTEADRHSATKLLSAIGTCEELQSEDHLDLMTATVGAGPAYPALLANVMIEFLTEAGIELAVAERAADGMMTGAGLLLAGKMQDISQTVQRFIDYNGTTAAGLKAVQSGGFERALKDGFRAATQRAKQMGDGF